MPYREQLDAANAQLDAMEDRLAERNREIGSLRAQLAKAENKKTKSPARARLKQQLIERLEFAIVMLVEGVLVIGLGWLIATAISPEQKPSGYVDYCIAQDCTDDSCKDASCAVTCLYGVLPGRNNDITYGRFDTLFKAVDAAEALGCPVRVTKETEQ